MEQKVENNCLFDLLRIFSFSWFLAIFRIFAEKILSGCLLIQLNEWNELRSQQPKSV